MKTMTRVLLVLGSALLGAVLAPATETPAPLAASRSDDWQTPTLPRRPDETPLALALVTSPIFEPEARSANAAAAAAPVDERWRIAGLLGRGSERSVLVSFSAPGRAPEVLRLGDKLPSGHRIQCIEPTAVCVQVGQKTLRIGVQTSD